MCDVGMLPYALGTVNQTWESDSCEFQWRH